MLWEIPLDSLPSLGDPPRWGYKSLGRRTHFRHLDASVELRDGSVGVFSKWEKCCFFSAEICQAVCVIMFSSDIVQVYELDMN